MHGKLDLQICLHIPDTVFDRDHVLAFTECRPVKRRQCKCNLADIHLIAPDRHPVHHGKGVIEKMRVDLRLQCLQFVFLQCDLVDIDLIDQTVDLIHHAVETVDQDSYFILRITAYGNFPASVVYPVHISGKLFDLTCKQSGKSHPQKQDDQATCRDQGDFFQKKPADRTGDRFLAFVEIKSPAVFFAFCTGICTGFTEFLDSGTCFVCFLDTCSFQAASVVKDCAIFIRDHSSILIREDIGQRLKDLVIIQRNADCGIQFLSTIDHTDSGNFFAVCIYHPLNPHIVLEFTAPPLFLHFGKRDQGILVFYLNALGKKLNAVDRIVIGFRHGQKRICDLGVFLICRVIIDVFFLDDLLNIRRISKIIQKTAVNGSLTVNTLLRLVDDRLHILQITASNHRTLSAVGIKGKNCHRHQGSHDQKNRQLVPVFHVFDPFTKSVHPLLFLSGKIPGCFHNIPGNSGRNRKRWRILLFH